MANKHTASNYSIIGRGKNLVLIHGLMTTGEFFDPIIPFLSENFRLIIPDLRGHGKNSEQKGPYTNNQFTKDIIGILDDLNIVRFSILGYSHGGTITQSIACEHSNRVDKLILVNSYSYKFKTFHEKIITIFVYYLIKIFNLFGYEKLVKLVGSGGGRNLSKTQLQKFISVVCKNRNKSAMVKTYKTMYSFDSRRWLKRIKCPTLIVRGKEDLAVPLHNSLMLEKGIKHSWIIEIPNAGHSMMLSHAKKLSEIFIKFLSDQ